VCVDVCPAGRGTSLLLARGNVLHDRFSMIQISLIISPYQDSLSRLFFLGYRRLLSELRVLWRAETLTYRHLEVRPAKVEH
jgi:hypothetical protein